MTRLLVFVVIMAVCAQSQAQFFGYLSNSLGFITGPEFESPKYAVSKTGANGEYEERTYIATKYVCTAEAAKEIPSRAMFMELFRYISGANENKTQIAMTVPVTTYVQKNGNETMYDMCFYIPEKFQADPPKPISSTVYFQDREQTTILTRKVSGFMWSESAWEAEAAALKALLEKNEEKNVDYSAYYRSGYDAPMKLFNRRNEVWYVKKA